MIATGPPTISVPFSTPEIMTMGSGKLGELPPGSRGDRPACLNVGNLVLIARNTRSRAARPRKRRPARVCGESIRSRGDPVPGQRWARTLAEPADDGKRPVDGHPGMNLGSATGTGRGLATDEAAMAEAAGLTR